MRIWKSKHTPLQVANAMKAFFSVNEVARFIPDFGIKVWENIDKKQFKCDYDGVNFIIWRTRKNSKQKKLFRQRA
jgi:hypothetical protein